MDLYPHQKLAVKKLKTGSILVGGVGSGKSRTALLYFYTRVCNGKVNPYAPATKYCDLYIITTARKRDTKEWVLECCAFVLPTEYINVTIDSWNNIEKYKDVKKAFFIFDEQRVVGSGKWAKTFIRIARHNDWILLSATPGDTWSDYIPVFIANGFYKNRTEFGYKHIVLKPFMNFPVIDHYINTKVLEKHRDDILVIMKDQRTTKRHDEIVKVRFNKELYLTILKERWNPWKEEPISDPAGLSYSLRRAVNSDESRIEEIVKIVKDKLKCIIFYNFNYERDMLRKMCSDNNFIFAEWNGSKHQEIPKGDSWVYLVQYAAGAEGWNCIVTNTIIFYSQNHSYKLTTQAAGRIDRINTPFTDLYYYKLMSDAYIDKAINKCLTNKKDFNENKFKEEEEDEFEKFYDQ